MATEKKQPVHSAQTNGQAALGCAGWLVLIPTVVALLLGLLVLLIRNLGPGLGFLATVATWLPIGYVVFCLWKGISEQKQPPSP